MKENTSIKVLKKQMAAAVAMVLVAAIALGSSTYAWFVNNAQVTATNVNVTATTAYSLQIRKTTGGYATTVNMGATNNYLVPVSTTGDLVATTGTLSTDRTSITAGDVRFVKSDAWSSEGLVNSYLEVGKNSTVPVVENGTSKGNQKLYYTDTVFLKAGQASKIYLDSTTSGVAITKDSSSNLVDFANVGSLKYPNPAEGEQTTFNANLDKTGDLLKTMRVGFMVTQKDNDRSTIESQKFYVYQLDETLINDAAVTGTSYNTSTVVGDGITKVDGVVAGISAESSAPAKYSATTETNFAAVGYISIPVFNSQTATGSQTALATDTNGKQVLATVDPNEEIQVDIYLWMEGCDYDTTAANSALFATTIKNIQFGFCVGAAS